NTGTSDVVSLAHRPAQENRSFPKSPEVADLLARAVQLLQADQPEKALELIGRSKISSPWITNALGGCHLRLGNTRLAVGVFLCLVVASGSLHLRSDVPAVFKTNFAVALLKADNMSGCLSALGEVSEAKHPAVGQINAVIERWKKSLTLWERIN